jgi:hypothetical protein
MSSYDPINEYVFAAALSGCVAGAIGAQPVTSGSEDVYAETSLTAFAFAQEFDTLWSTASLDVIQQAAILDMCAAYWYGRIPQTTTPAEYEDLCEALIAAVNEADATAIAGGATPPAYPPSGSSSGGVGLGAIIWRPGATTVGTRIAGTFADLQAAVTAGAMPIIVDSSGGAAIIPAGQTLAAPNGGNIELISFNAVQGNFTGGPPANVVTVADKGSITNLTLVLGGLILNFTCLTTPALTYTQSNSRLVMRGGNLVQLLTGATVPAYSVEAGFLFQTIMEFTSLLSGLTTVPVFMCAGGTYECFVAFNSILNDFGGVQAIGQTSGTCILAYDSTIQVPTLTLGTITYSQVSQETNQKFASGTAFPTTAEGSSPLRVGQPFFRTDMNVFFKWNGSAWVIPAFQNSTTVGRPTATTTGQMDFDTTLGIPIWWDGSAWVNSTGASV